MAHQRVVAQRPAEYFKPYNGEWRKVRDKFLAEHPYCVVCGRYATVVDHVIPLSKGGTHDGEKQAMCRSCHSRKTASVDGGWGNK